MTKEEFYKLHEAFKYSRDVFYSAWDELSKVYMVNDDCPEVIDEFSDAAHDMAGWAKSLTSIISDLLDERERLRSIIDEAGMLEEHFDASLAVRDVINYLQSFPSIKRACEKDADYHLERFGNFKGRRGE